MSVVLPTLLYLGLYLTQSTQAAIAQHRKPVITAQPGSEVQYNEPVTIRCQGPPYAEAYKIYKKIEPEPRNGSKFLVAGRTNTLYIQKMKWDNIGLYRCSYMGAGFWSPLSNPLQLVMTMVGLTAPVMKALPGPMVLYNEPVTILCQGPPDAEAYKIYKVEGLEPREERKLLVAGKPNTFSIQEMKANWTGLYHCSYERGVWSPPSGNLDLVMTGSYDKPSLSSISGRVVAPGNNVTLQCFSRINFDSFILTKDGAPQFTHRQSYTVQDNGLLITFYMDSVTSTQAGTYRCYGGFNKNSSMWSHPSDPLQLMVRGPAGWSVSPQNQVRLSLAGLFLLVLVVLVAEACYSHKRSFYGLRSDPYLSVMTNTEDTRGI
uniref:Immunoglobulin domain-containing protein n=1 Tax=Myotis myotis TaxID=51298 RepID=A0A7J7R0C2_MYOMY|nr:hypothetical protein mMyoMyo1_011233 [Myotis myotis]